MRKGKQMRRRLPLVADCSAAVAEIFRVFAQGYAASRRALCYGVALLAIATVPAQNLAQAQSPAAGDSGYRYNPNAQAQMQPQGERFFLNIPQGWKEVIRTRQQGADVIAYVPAAQNAGQWTDMLTIQVFRDMAALPAQTYYERSHSSYQKSCAAARAGELQTGLSNGYPSAFWVLACGQNQQQGFGETAFFRLVQGDAALYIVQRSWRTTAFDADTPPPVSAAASQQAIETLKSFGVCDPGLAGHPCP
jgi:uncharacterized protein YbdZ (MbtH family)